MRSLESLDNLVEINKPEDITKLKMSSLARIGGVIGIYVGEEHHMVYGLEELTFIVRSKDDPDALTGCNFHISHDKEKIMKGMDIDRNTGEPLNAECGVDFFKACIYSQWMKDYETYGRLLEHGAKNPLLIKSRDDAMIFRLGTLVRVSKYIGVLEASYGKGMCSIPMLAIARRYGERSIGVITFDFHKKWSYYKSGELDGPGFNIPDGSLYNICDHWLKKYKL